MSPVRVTVSGKSGTPEGIGNSIAGERGLLLFEVVMGFLLMSGAGAGLVLTSMLGTVGGCCPILIDGVSSVGEVGLASVSAASWSQLGSLAGD